jgi:hypothetical protein
MDNQILDSQSSTENSVQDNVEKRVPKKRGRKPKKKILEESVSQAKQPKKRGRKVKEVKEEVVKLPKKRGRKPKISNVQMDIKNKVSSDNLILHLPIKIENDNSHPKPFDEDENYKEVEFNSKTEEIDSTNLDFDEYIKSRELILNNSKDLFFEFIESNRKGTWPKKTNIHCLWDSYPFDNTPFGIPIKKTSTHIEMFGNFCSPECAAAYLFSLNDNVWERYSLLNELYGTNEPIKVANSKLLLKKFGGIYGINEFRSLNINCSKKYNICLPPTLAHIPTLEETKIDIDESLTVNKESIKKINTYKLQRKKQTNEENSLENIMNLKYL